LAAWRDAIAGHGVSRILSFRLQLSFGVRRLYGFSPTLFMRELHPIDRAQRDIDVAVYACIVAGTLTLVLSLLVLMAHTASSWEHTAAVLDVVISFGLACCY
jgi:hypothetical protein